MQDVICFKDKTSAILREHHANLQLGEENNQIIKTALKLICNDIATINLDPKTYPTVQSMSNISSQLELVPESLKMLLRPILKTDEKVAIWGQILSKLVGLGQGYCLTRWDSLYNLIISLGQSGCSTSCTSWGTVSSYKTTSIVSSTARQRVETSNSPTLNTIVEETDDQVNNEFEVDAELENLSALVTTSESATPDEVPIEIESIDSSQAVTQFVGDNIDYYLWEQFLSFDGFY